jgi:hypothetical protein
MLGWMNADCQKHFHLKVFDAFEFATRHKCRRLCNRDKYARQNQGGHNLFCEANL